MKKIIAMLLALALCFSLVACGNGGTTETKNPGNDSPTNGYVQGVDEKTIKIGNTAANTGAFAVVGVPFLAGLEAVIKQYNDAGGFDGKMIEFVHYDDNYDAAQGTTYTKTLVETDKVFALVGHYGTNTVDATLDYIKSTGIPMVYGVTGVSSLYQEGATGKDACVLPVQPIYTAEGRVLLARAVASEEGGMGLGGTKIGVITSTDASGEGMLEGIKRQAEEGDFDIVYQEVQLDAADFNAALNVLKNAGCDVVIAGMEAGALTKVLTGMRDINFNAKVIGSYVTASAYLLGDLVASGAITEDRPYYATGWMDIFTEQGAAEFVEFQQCMLAWEAEQGIAPADGYSLNSYAMAGYVCGMAFVHGLNQVKELGLELNWDNYVKAMESKPFHIPMGGDVSFANGDRLGVTALALSTVGLEINPEVGYYELVTVSPITPLDEVWAAVK